ncbi:MAG TPA: DUF932 domain-containing protein [Holophaga sp.]|nr:DUF932 domain-containing protein [Holophaga sp.]
MNPGSTIQDVVGQILADAKEQQDYIVPTKALAMDEDQTLRWGNSTGHLTSHAHGQMADYLGIPRRFYDRMREKTPDLISINVNRLLQVQAQEADGPERRMLRTTRGDVRAILSDRYRRMDNLDVAERILPMLHDRGFEIESISLTDTRFYLQAISPKLEGEIRVGDTVQLGWALSNSEIGMGRLWLQPLVKRLICTNGMIISEFAQKKAHLGVRFGEGSDEAFLIDVSDDARRAADDALWLGLRDHVSALTSADGLQRVLGTLRERAEDKVKGDPDAVIEVLADKFSLVEHERKSVLYSYLGEGDCTRWGLANAITQVANNHEDYDRAIELEKRGGDLMSTMGPAWKAIAEAE